MYPAVMVDPDILRVAAAMRDAREGRLPLVRAFALRDLADRHGVLPLLAHSALASDASASTLQACECLSDCLRDAAARDLVQLDATRRAIEALARAGVPTLVLKGEHLARAYYDPPHLRPRGDADLLVSIESRETARAVLEDLGYVAVPDVSRGDAILAELPLVRCDGTGVRHAIDLHWHVVTPHPFRNSISFETAWSRSVAVPAIGPAARGLCAPDVILHVAMHAAVHHPDTVRLIWVCDIDRIARSLDADGWAAFESAAASARACVLAHAALDAAVRLLDTPVPSRIMDALQTADDEPAARRYLSSRSKASRLVGELRAISRWRDRAAVVYQHLVPDANYMEARYSVRGARLLWKYVMRVARGARVWLQKPAASGLRAPVDRVPPGPRAG